MASFANHAARLAALAAGDKHFDPGEACSRGHTSPRYAGKGTPCVACLRISSQARTSAKRLAKGLDPVARYGRRDPNAKPRPTPKPKKDFEKATFVKSPLLEACIRYSQSIEARERSRYLDGLIKNLTASASKKVPTCRT